MMQGPFLLCLCQRGAFTGSQMISFSAVPLSRKRKAVSDRPIHKWNKPSCTAGKPGRMILSVRPDTLGQTYKIILPCRWFTRFHASGYPSSFKISSRIFSSISVPNKVRFTSKKIDLTVLPSHKPPHHLPKSIVTKVLTS